MAKMAKWPQNGVKHADQMRLRLRLLLLSSSFAHWAWLLFFMAFSLIDLSESDNRPSKQQALTRLSDPGNPTRPIDTPRLTRTRLSPSQPVRVQQQVYRNSIQTQLIRIDFIPVLCVCPSVRILHLIVVFFTIFSRSMYNTRFACHGIRFYWYHIVVILFPFALLLIWIAF